MNIVCFGQRNWDSYWVTEQHLLSRLARRGHRVLVIDPDPAGDAASSTAALFSWRQRCQVNQVQDGLHVLTLRPLGNLPAGLATAVRKRTIARAAEHWGLWAPVAICLDPRQQWLLKAVNPSATIFFARVDSTPASQDPRLPQQRAHELELLRQCDLALAVAPAMVTRFRAVQPNSFLQENGVDLEDFTPGALAAVDPHPLLASLPRPRLGFVGTIDGRLDQDLLVRLAQHFAAASVVLAGRVDEKLDVNRLRQQRNIVFTGLVDYRQLGSVYRELDLGLVPFLQHVQTGNPLKIYEYLAADLPTVATDLQGLDSPRQAIRVGPSHDEFIAAVEAELRDPGRQSAQRRRVAETASWQRRADQFEERLNQALSVADARRRRDHLAAPRPDRHGKQVIRVEPRLDGKDASVRLLHDNYESNRLSPQQHLLYLVSRILGLGYYCLRRIGRLLRGDAGPVRRILVVRNGHLGDTVVFLPTLAALRGRFPKAKITVALAPGSGAQQLLEASPYVDEVLALDFFNRSRRDRFRGAARLLAGGFDLAVGGVWYFHLPEAVFSGAPLRLGLYDGHPLQRYADRVTMLDPNLHEAENNLRLVELVTGVAADEQRAPHLKLDEAALARKALEMRAALGLAADTPVVALHPGSKRPSRRWPAARFAELAAGLLGQRPQLHIVFTGAGREEQELIASIRKMVPQELQGRTHDGVGASDLLGVIGFYDTCKLLVCNDTGVMHVARARGVPLVAIIGPENDRRWGPHPLGPGLAVSVRNQVPGTPHGKWECEWNLSLQSIDAERIKSHCDALLDGTFKDLQRVEPVQMGSERFYPLVRDVRRLSFAQLQERGLALPKVAAILPIDPRLLGGEGACVQPEVFAAAARGLRRQHYPALQPLLVVRSSEQLLGLDTGPADVVPVPADNPDSAWASVLSATDAVLFWLTNPMANHAPTALPSRVGVYLRGPQAAVMDGERAWPLRTLIDADLLSGRWLIERRALEDLLAHPLASPGRAVAEELPQDVFEPALA